MPHWNTHVDTCRSSLILGAEGTEYTRQMLYWECRGQQYYAGVLAVATVTALACGMHVEARPAPPQSAVARTMPGLETVRTRDNCLLLRPGGTRRRSCVSASCTSSETALIETPMRP